MKVKSLSRVRLFLTPWTAVYQAPPSMGFSRQEYWSGVPSPSPLYPATLLNSLISSSKFLILSLGFSMYSIWRRQWQSTPVLLPGKSHGWRSLGDYSPWGHEESDMTEQLHFHFSLSCIGEGNGNPLQCSCLENPRDRGAWWAAVYGVTQSWTRLKRLSSSSSSMYSIMSSANSESFISFPIWIPFFPFSSLIAARIPNYIE